MSRPAGKTLYALLGVPSSASQPELDAAYLRLQKQLAEVVLDQRQRDERLRQLEAAYQLLSNPVRRSVYDASLQKGDASTVQIDSSRPVPVKTIRMGGGPSLGLIALIVFVVFGLAYFYYVHRQQALVESFRNEAVSVQQRAIERQEAMMREVEEANEGTAEERAAAVAARQAEDAERKAKYEQQQREYEFDRWNDQVASEQSRTERDSANKARQAAAERERERRAAEQQEERDRRVAEERVERERRGLMEQLLSEKRFGEARQIAKSEAELRSIERAEKYAR